MKEEKIKRELYKELSLEEYGIKEEDLDFNSIMQIYSFINNLYQSLSEFEDPQNKVVSDYADKILQKGIENDDSKNS